MGKCVVHMQKIKASGVRGIQSHINREHESKTNLDIDKERTKDNWHIWQCDDMHGLIKHNIRMNASQTKTVRKDAVMLCSFIVTSDEQTMKAMSPEQQKQFFKDAEDFFSHRYGAENIVYASIHMDETTPHMHLGVVPIQNEKLCAKDMFNAKELKSLQTDFAQSVGKKYGLERGVEDSHNKHLSEMRFKAQKAAEKVAELEKRVNALESRKNDLEGELGAMEQVLARKDDEGLMRFGKTGWLNQIQAQKQLDKDKRELDSYRSFMKEFPNIGAIFEQYRKLGEKKRTKSRGQIKE